MYPLHIGGQWNIFQMCQCVFASLRYEIVLRNLYQFDFRALLPNISCSVSCVTIYTERVLLDHVYVAFGAGYCQQFCGVFRAGCLGHFRIEFGALFGPNVLRSDLRQILRAGSGNSYSRVTTFWETRKVSHMLFAFPKA